MNYYNSLSRGGEGGIRTPDTVARMPHFECGAFNHSATSPRGKKLKWSRPYLAAAPQRHKVAAGKVNQFHDLDGFSIARTWRHCRKRRGQSAEASKNSKP